jgi:uncharacterized protein
VQALHSARVSLGTGAFLDIECVGGEAGPRLTSFSNSPIVECMAEVAPDEAAQLGVPAMCWRDDGPVLFEPLQLREQTDYLIDITIPEELSRAVAEWQRNSAWPLSDKLQGFYHTDPPRRWLSDGGTLRLGGRLNFGNYAGVASLQIAEGDAYRVEVVPKKLGYLEDFRDLLTEVGDELVELLIQLEAPTLINFALADLRSSDPLILLFHLRRIMADHWLPAACEFLLHRPQSMMQQETHKRSLAEAEEPNLEAMSTEIADAEFYEGGPLSSLFRGFTPRNLPERRQRESYDTRENRYIKAFLEHLMALVEFMILTLHRRRMGTAIRETTLWRERLADWLAHPLWREVGVESGLPSNSQTLFRRAGYREILAAALGLEAGVALPWKRAEEFADGLDGDLRPVHELYQYWCFFVLLRALRIVCGSEGRRAGTLIKRSTDGLELQLRQGFESRIEFTYLEKSLGRTEIHLYYNRTFAAGGAKIAWDGSYSGEYVPDFSIMLRRQVDDQRLVHWLHFDAKYRLTLRRLRAPGAEQGPDVQSPRDAGDIAEAQAVEVHFRADSIDEMHVYRDALLGSRGAYVLYPGTGERSQVYVRFPHREGAEGDQLLPSVGAFQLRPGAQSAEQFNVLRLFLKDAVDRIAGSRGPYAEETGFAAIGPLNSG